MNEQPDIPIALTEAPGGYAEGLVELKTVSTPPR